MVGELVNLVVIAFEIPTYSFNVVTSDWANVSKVFQDLLNNIFLFFSRQNFPQNHMQKMPKSIHDYLMMQNRTCLLYNKKCREIAQLAQPRQEFYEENKNQL